ncbi:MAG: DUF4012 domain-containing protein [Candidatus Gracilibacteria bacterium]
MFSARYLFHQAKHTFWPVSHWSKWKVILHIFAATVLFVLLWFVSALGALRTFMPNMFQLMGWPGTDRTYLVLFQNNAELQPTGGRIKAYALIEFKNGFPSEITFEDAYDPLSEASTPLTGFPSENAAPGVYFDLTATPDFPGLTTQILNRFYEKYPNTTVDGVIAINFSVLEDIVKLYEPIRVDRYTLTHDNLFETLENAVSDIDRHNEEALAKRKDVINEFARVMTKKMVLQFWRWRSLSEVMTRNLNQKEILATFENESLAEKVRGLNWDGNFQPVSPEFIGNFLAIRITNDDGMKSDRYITREVEYTIDLEKNEAALEVTLTHYGDYNPPLSGSYKGFLDVYLPKGVTLDQNETPSVTVEEVETVLDATLEPPASSVELFDEVNYVRLRDTIELIPGKSHIFTYSFQLNPKWLAQNPLSLLLIKQPGTDKDPYRVTFKAPMGQSLAGIDFEAHENVAFFEGNLSEDKTLELMLLPDESGPRLFWHEMSGGTSIELIFAEPVDVESAQDPANYEVRDLNLVMLSVTDSPEIDFVTVEGGNVRLYLKGVTVQVGEYYQVLMRNIQDLNGNYITPNPRTVTVVQ